jgi:uncharacterized protein (DUF488 family)
MRPAPALFTIGHSNHSLAHFILLLRQHGVTAVADVRSAPYSRRYPHFNRQNLAEALHGSADITYVFLGAQLGARPEEPECFTSDGRVRFDRLGESLGFRNGIRRVVQGLQIYRIALMCAERDPLDCHRGILIAPRIMTEAPSLSHIGPEGELESHAAAEQRLMTEFHFPDRGLFDSHAQLLAEAYRRREEQIAWRRTSHSQESGEI